MCSHINIAAWDRHLARCKTTGLRHTIFGFFVVESNRVEQARDVSFEALAHANDGVVEGVFRPSLYRYDPELDELKERTEGADHRLLGGLIATKGFDAS